MRVCVCLCVCVCVWEWVACWLCACLFTNMRYREGKNERKSKSAVHSNGILGIYENLPFKREIMTKILSSNSSLNIFRVTFAKNKTKNGNENKNDLTKRTIIEIKEKCSKM